MSEPEDSVVDPLDAADQFRNLPPQIPSDTTVAYQSVEENRFGGPGGGGDNADGDGD